MPTTDASDRERSTRRALQIKRWLVAAVGMGFLGLTLDVFLEHDFTVHSMRSPQWTPVAFGPLAAAVALITAWRFDAITRNFETFVVLTLIPFVPAVFHRLF